jgi:hypothetical protein
MTVSRFCLQIFSCKFCKPLFGSFYRIVFNTAGYSKNDENTPVRLAPNFFDDNATNRKKQEKTVARKLSDDDISFVSAAVTTANVVYGAAVNLTDNETTGSGRRIWYPLSSDNNPDVTAIDEVINMRWDTSSGSSLCHTSLTS